MHCCDCGGIYQDVFNCLIFDDENIGSYRTKKVNYKQCNKCYEKIFGYEALCAIEDAFKQKLNYLLLKEPLINFISSDEVCNRLEMTRRELNKKNKLYFVKIGKIKLYHTPSVEAFKATNDGRIKLI